MNSGRIKTRSQTIPVKPSRHISLLICRSYSGGTEGSQMRSLMLKYVKECSPDIAQQFLDNAPLAVTSAMRSTITNMVGSLPPSYFEVKVSTAAESLAQLFFTMSMTGYLFASGQHRMELQSALSVPSPALLNSQPIEGEATSETPTVSTQLLTTSSILRSSSSSQNSISNSSSDPGGTVILLPGEEEYAPGVQKRDIQGQVLRWHHENGLERMGAEEYMSHLEAQVASLKELLSTQVQQEKITILAKTEPVRGVAPYAGPTGGKFPFQNNVGSAAATAAAAAAAGSGELLDFLRSLSGESMGELTASACPEVLDAIDAFVARLMGTGDREQLRSMSSEFSAMDLSKVLLWLMVVGYTLRTAEMKLTVLSFNQDGGGGGGDSNDSEGGLFGVGGPGKKGPLPRGPVGHLGGFLKKFLPSG